MTGIDAKTPPLISKFNRNKYCYLNSKQDSNIINNINNGKNYCYIYFTKLIFIINSLHNKDYSFIPPLNIITRKTPLELVTVNLKKKSPFKSNIQVTKGMIFKDLITFVLPSGLLEEK